MPKLGMEPIRRRQLIDAAIASIDAEGYSGTTVAKICRRAGVSGGLAHHYFEGKDDLLHAALRDLLRELHRAGLKRLRRAATPMARAEAIIDANFDADFFTRPKVSAWLSFWAELQTAPALQRLQRINAGRMRSNLTAALRPLLPAPRAEAAAHGLCALIDGLWLEWAVGDRDIDRAAARRLCHDYLTLQLTRDRP